MIGKKGTLGDSDLEGFEPRPDQVQVHYRGEDEHGGKRISTPLKAVIRFGDLFTTEAPSWHNGLFLTLYASLIAAAVGVLWFGVIPLRSSYSDDKSDRLTWILLVNPGTAVMYTYLNITLFLSCLDKGRPWRPLSSYAHILVASYVVQVACPGLIVLFYEPFKATGIVSITLSVVVAVVGLLLTPHTWFSDDEAHFIRCVKQWVKVSFVLLLSLGSVYWYVIIVSTEAVEGGEKLDDSDDESTETDDREGLQGVVAFALSIFTFILKKTLLSLCDTFAIEAAMIVSGLWADNLVELFITLAYPSATSPSVTFGMLVGLKILENLAYLVFQTDRWFTFRVWIKGRLTCKHPTPILEDLNPDDRGHSNQRPGYRRRQLRFLLFKLVGQVESNIVLLAIMPVLRYGWNSEFYPYIEEQRAGLQDVPPNAAGRLMDEDATRATAVFGAVSILIALTSAALVVMYMKKQDPLVLREVIDKHALLFRDGAWVGFVLTVLVANVLVAVSALQVQARVFFI